MGQASHLDKSRLDDSRTGIFSHQCRNPRYGRSADHGDAFLMIFALSSFWWLAAVWLDDRAKIDRKLTMSLTVLPAYFIVLANILVYPPYWASQAILAKLSRN